MNRTFQAMNSCFIKRHHVKDSEDGGDNFCISKISTFLVENYPFIASFTEICSEKNNSIP